MIDEDERENHGGHTYNGGYQQKELWKQAWENYDIRYEDMFSPAIMVVGDKKGREHIWWFDVVCQ